MDLDIVLLPPKNISEKIGQSVLAIHRRVPLALTVDNKKLLPHISLLHLKASARDLIDIIKTVEAIALETKPFKICFNKPSHGELYFVININNTKSLRFLHQIVVKNVSLYKNGQVNLPPKGRTVLQRSYIKKYGVGNILKYFGPHITLGHVYKIKDQNKILKLVGQIKFQNFIAKRLAVAQVNKYHQVYKIIKEYKVV